MTANVSAAAPMASTPVEAQAEVEVLDPAHGGWRSFATAAQAHRFARRMECRGFCTNVFYDPCADWWVCEFF